MTNNIISYCQRRPRKQHHIIIVWFIPFVLLLFYGFYCDDSYDCCCFMKLLHCYGWSNNVNNNIININIPIKTITNWNHRHSQKTILSLLGHRHHHHHRPDTLFHTYSHHHHYCRQFGIITTNGSRRYLSSIQMTKTSKDVPVLVIPDNNNSNNNDYTHVVVIGSINYDMTIYTNRLPTIGETILGGIFQTSCGGKGSNQAIASASCSSTSKTTMICRLGNDIFGEKLYKNLIQHHVNIDPNYCWIDNNPNNENEANTVSSGVACITVDTNTGDNMIIVAPGTNELLKPNDVREQLLSLLLSTTSPPTVILLQLEIPYETIHEALYTINNNNTKTKTKPITILNPAPAPNNIIQYNILQSSFQYIDILIPNEIELRTLYLYSINIDVDNHNIHVVDHTITEEHMAKHILIHNHIRYAVIVTLGERGAMIVERVHNNFNNHNNNLNNDDIMYNETKTIHVTEPINIPCKNELIIDTIGAGDGFCGSFASYLSYHHYYQKHNNTTTASIDLSYLCSLACGYASMSIRRMGASYPTYNELPDCLRIMDSLSSPIIHNDSNRNDKDIIMNDTALPSSSLLTLNNSDNAANNKPQIVFVTGNKNKLREVQQILLSSSGNEDDVIFPYDIINESIDLPELQGDDTITIAKEKCIIAAKQYIASSSSSSSSYPRILLTEDTSLCFNALNGMPGPYIKWFLKNCGHDGLNQMLMGYDDKTGYALTIVALIIIDDNSDNHDKPHEVHIFEGRTDGIIVPPRGSLDFGWDPIFQPNHHDSNETYAEMSKDVKNLISHRGKAFVKVREFLINYYHQQSNMDNNDNDNKKRARFSK